MMTIPLKFRLFLLRDAYFIIDDKCNCQAFLYVLRVRSALRCVHSRIKITKTLTFGTAAHMPIRRRAAMSPTQLNSHSAAAEDANDGVPKSRSQLAA